MRDMGLISVREIAKEFYEKGKNCYNNHLKQQFSVPHQIKFGLVTLPVSVLKKRITIFARSIIPNKIPL